MQFSIEEFEGCVWIKDAQVALCAGGNGVMREQKGEGAKGGRSSFCTFVFISHQSTEYKRVI